MKVEIDTEKETIYVVAVCIGGWGKGRTIAEALRNMRDASRGLIKKNYTMDLYPDGGKKKVTKNIDELIDDQCVRFWLTNDNTVTTEWYTFIPSEGKWAIYLGDQYNDVKARINNGKEK